MDIITIAAIGSAVITVSAITWLGVITMRLIRDAEPKAKKNTKRRKGK